MAGSTPIYGIPYPESSDLVANYPALGESLAEQVEDKLPTYAATAPTSPSVGQVWVDSSGPIGKVWDGSAWTIFSGAGAANFSDTATGTYTDGGINYKYKTYTGSGTLTITSAGFADVLVIGGGAGGGSGDGASYYGAGGGAGGYQSFTNVFLQSGISTVTIGAGGAINTSGVNSLIALNGLATVYSYGGGAGGGAIGSPLVGGSGGGGRGSSLTNGINGLQGQGNAGGNGQPGGAPSGGGGGAGGAGNNYNVSNGVGGVGLASSITGTSITRAKGGDGYYTAGQGVPVNSPANSGSGGMGGYLSVGGTGGSGVIILRVKV